MGVIQELLAPLRKLAFALTDGKLGSSEPRRDMILLTFLRHQYGSYIENRLKRAEETR